MKTIIFTDLDGTLLDPETYSAKAARPALELARRKDAAVIFVSSKTRAEIEVWRTLLGNGHPFVVENGGGIYIPRNYFNVPVPGKISDDYRIISFGKPYEQIRRQFVEMRDRLGIAVRGFGDMSLGEVASLTGLARNEAELAKKRDFSEPFVFLNGADERFLQAIEGEKLRWTQGQFFHIMGNHHKGRAVERLRDLYKRENNSITTIGIGDSLNDLPFLLTVDRPVLIKKANGRHDPRIRIPGIVRTQGIGPKGWSEAVMNLLT